MTWSTPPSPEKLQEFIDAEQEKITTLTKSLASFAELEARNRGVSTAGTITAVLTLCVTIIQASAALIPQDQRQAYIDDLLKIMTQGLREGINANATKAGPFGADLRS